jgi:S-adenosylmethionine/arginine decarboxylase-like enzyme
MNYSLYHKHIMIRAYVKKPLIDVDETNEWFHELVGKVGMEVAVPAKSAYVTREGNEGITGSVNLCTSHSSIHVWDQESPAKIEFDLYSCSDFDLITILEHIDCKMGLIRYHSMTIDRNAVPFEIIHQDEGYMDYSPITLGGY